MTLSHMALAILLSGLAVSMTDWFFFGVLFHDKYLAYPEIWRPLPGGEGSSPAERSSSPALPFTCADTPPPQA